MCKTLCDKVQQQISLKYFDKIVEFPVKQRYERWKAYVSRIFDWDQQRLERAQKKGMYRPIPHYPVTPAARGLLVTLAWHSYAEGSDYYPMRLSQRQAGALMGDYTRKSGVLAQHAIDELVEVGAIERLEEAKGSRAALYRIITSELKQTKPVVPSRAQSAPKGTKAIPRAPHNEVDESKLTTAVRTRFPDLHPNVIRALIDTVGVSVLQRQLEWFPYRDNSWAWRGEVAAYVSYCRRDEPCPSSIVRRERDEREAQRRRLATERYEKEVDRGRESSSARLASMDAGALSELKERVKAKLGKLFTGEDSAVFRRMLEAEATA